MMSRKDDIHPLKKINANMIMHVLSEMKTATRKQLAERTGLSQPTVNTIVQELEEKGIVRPGNFAASEGGRRPKCYTLQTDHLRAAVVRLLPQSLAYLVMTIDGKVIQRNVWALTETDSHLEKLQTLLQTLTKQDENIRVISVGVPGVVGPGGVLFSISQVPSLEGVALSRALEEHLDIPVYVENDLNLVALGSTVSGLTKPDSDIVFVHVGQGVGAGVVMGGRIVRGFSNFAGEIAFMVKDAGDGQCGEALESLIIQTDSLARKAELIAEPLINIICLLNPPTIAFGGELISEELLRHLRQICEQHLPIWALPTFHFMVEEDAAYEKGLLTLVHGVLSQTHFAQAEGNVS